MPIDPNPAAHAYSWFECHMGQDLKCSPAYYNAWSGWVSDISELAVVAAILGWYKHIKCATCLRPGVHKMEDTGQRTCHVHSTHAHHDVLRAWHKRKYPDHVAHNEAP